MRVSGRLLAGLVGMLVLATAQAGAQDEKNKYLEELIGQARAQGLAVERQWLTLGYYRPGWFGRNHLSTIDSAGFFSAENGKADPGAELEALLASFFAPAVSDGTQHPQCKWIARYNWLKQRLEFNSEKLPEQPCLAFTQWYESLDPTGVALIFPSAYLNKPESMLGHTLLRIDGRDRGQAVPSTARAVNYGAISNGERGIGYAFKGLIGSYRGNFAVTPYDGKVRKYRDLENRDIWEYQLNSEQAEIRRLMMTLWELRQHYAHYYFIDENCSYHLLSLLEAARPSLHLTDRFDGWAIPVDVVRAVVEQEGLVSQTAYMPSSRADIDNRLDQLNRRERQLSYDLALGLRRFDDAGLAELPPARQAAVLEVAYEYLRYRSRIDKVEDGSVAALSSVLSSARAGISADAEVKPLSTPAARPDEGHGFARLSLGGGRMDDLNFLEVRVRPFYHNLIDPQGGFVAGTEIEFLDIALRYYEGAKNAEFEAATVLSIQSIAPRNGFFKPISWRIDLGAERFRRSGPAGGDVVGTLGGAVGLSYELWNNAMLSGFLDGRVTGTSDLPDKVLVDVGPSIGFLYNPTSWWAMNLTGTYGFALDGGRTTDSLDARLEQSFGGRSFAFRMYGGLKGDADNPFPEYGASLNWYF